MRKNSKKTNVKSSILVLLLIAILLIASTYAWFTANTTVTISTLDVHVEATNGLQISANAIDWKAVLEKAEITPGAEGSTLNTKYSGNVNQLPVNLTPVSTIGEIANNKLKMFKGTVAANPSTGVWQLTSEAESEEHRITEETPNADFIAFDIFLKIDKETPVKLTGTSGVIAKTVGTGPDAVTDDRGLKNASRVAFLVLGNCDALSSTSTMQGLSGGTGLGTDPKQVYIWEPNYDVHTADGQYNASQYYGQTVSLTGNAAPLAYEGLKSAFSTPLALNANSTSYPDYFAGVTPDIATIYGNTTKQSFLTLKPGVTKIRVYMWIEGQDVDCENSASGSDIQLNLGFTIDE